MKTVLLTSRLTGNRLPVHFEALRVCEFKKEEAKVKELYRFSNSLMKETYPHWLQHAETNEQVHLFRHEDGTWFSLV